MLNITWINCYCTWQWISICINLWCFIVISIICFNNFISSSICINYRSIISWFIYSFIQLTNIYCIRWIYSCRNICNFISTVIKSVICKWNRLARICCWFIDHYSCRIYNSCISCRIYISSSWWCSYRFISCRITNCQSWCIKLIISSSYTININIIFQAICKCSTWLIYI